jgi:hypothetical protein
VALIKISALYKIKGLQSYFTYYFSNKKALDKI